MSDTYRPRRVLAVLAALLLPAATCGIAPTLRDLVRRMELLESRSARLEKFAAEAQLPPVLVDEHSIVIGTVLEYNDMFLYSSVRNNFDQLPESPYMLPEDFAVATLQVPVPGRAPLMIEANREELLTPNRGTEEDYFFESPDCTGTPWVSAQPHPVRGRATTFFPRAWIGSPGKTLYALAPDAPAERVVTRSLLRSFGIIGTTTTCLESLAPSTGYGRRFEPVANLDVYTPPFRIMDQRELWGW